MPYFDLDHDIAHEEDYESEDYDYQPEEFKMQHFKKQGWLFPWIIAGNLVFIFVWVESMYQHFPDDDYYRKPHPPTLEDATPTVFPEYHQFYNMPEFIKDLDSGLEKVYHVYYDDDRLIYGRFAGVNRPLQYILEDREEEDG